MSAFLLLLIKLNLAMGAATILVSLLRRPLRVLFGAPIAYAIWFLVPIAGTASLFPPRVALPVPVTPVEVAAAPLSIIGHIAHSAQPVTEQLTGQGSLMLSAIAAPSPASAFAMPDTALLLFVAWVLGMLFMALYLARLQVRFYAAVRLGEAGPAVLGFLRPRIVTPDSFQERFTAQEQAAILAHERVHLARQDARINALTALLRCLCWFNPLIHLGARLLRIDQELACDATAVTGAISRRTYAQALLKSQMVVTALPLGCNWPGSQHPLVERIALLQRKPPGAARRIAGVGLVMLVATSAGLGAWAVQPPVAAKSMAAPQPGIALPSPPAIRAAQDQPAGNTGPSQPVAPVNSTGSALPTAALPTNQVATNQAAQQAFQTSEAATTSATTRSAAAPPLPKMVSVSETGAASHDPPATTVQPPPNASPAVALNDQPVAPSQPTTRDLSAGPVQVALSTPPATPAKSDSNEPYVKTTCKNVPENTVTGRVTSSKTIQIPSFDCGRFIHGLDGFHRSFNAGPPGGPVFGHTGGSCKNQDRGTPILTWGCVRPNRPWLTMTVQLANPADASKMSSGKLVTLTGDFFVLTKDKLAYFFVQNARVLYTDPFGR